MKIHVYIIILLISSIFYNCKNRADSPETGKEHLKIVPQQTVDVSSIAMELLKFADTDLVEGSDINQVLDVKKIDTNGIINTIDSDEGFVLYKGMKKRNGPNEFPIFEIKQTTYVILPVKGTGFGGPIWAKVMVDRITLEIKKIAFEHEMESDGYGAAMTQSSFEDKFAGIPIDLEKNTFILQKNIEERMGDGIVVDGISGATITSEAVVEMLNNGLRQYRKYLKPL